MSPLSRAWFPCVCVMTVLLAVPALAGARKKQDRRVLGEGSSPREAQLIGWSSDEDRFVFRVYTDDTETEGMNTVEEEPKDPFRGEDGFCKGYVNHEGKPFKGALAFQVFDNRGRVAMLPIQDSGRCTPPTKAAQRLTDAKKKLAALGISLERRGTVLIPKEGELRLEVKDGARAPYTLELVDDTKAEYLEEKDVELLQGTLRLLVHREGQRRALWEKQVKRMYPTYMGYRLTVARMDVSPSGERVVLLLRGAQGGMNDRDGKLWMDAVVEVPPGDATAGGMVP
ncbi:hypothetical protein [Archangium sp.]|uniref:hypothetical protein n=1 Tax=Archangium sp. TaxID=1872627 RepID=UPI00286B4494|nr:hypothetical protein [Archangium sp.]